MTDSEHKILTTYVRNLADRLGLKDWVIDVELDGLREDDVAGSTLLNNAHQATLRFATDRLTKPLDLRADAIHELLHCHLWNARCVVCLDLWKTSALPKTAFDLLKSTYERQIELTVESLAVAIAPFFELIDWETSDGKQMDSGGD